MTSLHTLQCSLVRVRVRACVCVCVLVVWFIGGCLVIANTPATDLKKSFEQKLRKQVLCDDDDDDDDDEDDDDDDYNANDDDLYSDD